MLAREADAMFWIGCYAYILLTNGLRPLSLDTATRQRIGEICARRACIARRLPAES